MSLDAQILAALRSCPTGVLGADLAQRLRVTPAVIWARIEDLRRLGYEIAATPHQGYRLVKAPDTLHADDILARLDGHQVVGRAIQVFERTASTNDLIDRLGREGSQEGIAIFAEAQTRGRGRLGRSWESPPRLGLWFSVLLRPGWAPPRVTRLVVMAAVAVRQGVQAVTGLAPEIKWPNDLQMRGLKIGGILSEMSAELDRLRYVVLGIGLNVNQRYEDLPAELRGSATSLRLVSGGAWDRAELAVAILRALDDGYARLCRGDFFGLAEEWEAACTTIGREVTIRAGDRCLRGRAESLDEDGALLVRSEYGHLEPVTGGDVTVEG
jgi:BirA family transcriptional regulator, biotin operon repressor / biotin---[acetyl-CoA-carboxylase] ligase